ncbi:flagellar biosynthesis anti-sigma factor FlgM [Photobacterium gaetbulicola]|uniref:Negative regulator of flagellin synthesis n=1 Tax=Photobacterium gaetbulicola Gung47 TaxID=658445 RepID=A0A0C5W8D4_9GAMM|nr:flagellar biosynthesis anti-sigma factor FlgM [Photobacterium gaetbulicola]AJR07791.1 putative lateral flagella anti-sigma-28 factor, LfgM [Photobacterium gaetbulicola Gung47]PSU03413.1 flagellar biosynthesis anti-sigma factor FlgM [Photobacterium gaetbulicola]
MIESTKASLQLAPAVQNQAPKTSEEANNHPVSKSPAPVSQVTKASAGVSAQAQSLDSLQQELKRIPDVDMAKVNEIRTLLASGNYEVDLDGLAASIRGAHRRD